MMSFLCSVSLTEMKERIQLPKTMNLRKRNLIDRYIKDEKNINAIIQARKELFAVHIFCTNIRL